jgi:hypothetical protein
MTRNYQAFYYPEHFAFVIERQKVAIVSARHRGSLCMQIDHVVTTCTLTLHS